jgi:glutaredoxin
MEIPMNIQLKEQQCSVAGLALSWIGYAAGFGYFSLQRQWISAALWVIGVPTLRWVLFHFFPHVSRFLGYGRIIDKQAPVAPAHPQGSGASVNVTFYSFFSCPFCPIVLARLRILEKQMGFTLTMIDVTLKPQTLIRKGIRSVPVVEVGTHRLVGNSTTEQLARMITLAQVPELLQAN